MGWVRCSSGGSNIEHLFDVSDFIDNIYIKTNGDEEPYDGWSATDYISVTPGETLLCSLYDSWRDYQAWYDENKNFISNFTINASRTTYTTITVPNNAKYFRISNETWVKGTIIIWRELS